MSRIGKQPITIPAGVTVAIDHGIITVAGAKDKLNLSLPPQIKAEVVGDQLLVSSLSPSKQSKANHGSIRAQLYNMVVGVVTPWK